MKCDLYKMQSMRSLSLKTFVATGVLALLNLKVINGFTVGVPPLRSVCITMNPQHHDYVAQGSDPPYEVSVNKNQVDGGDTVDFTLKSIESDKKTKFIGFYVQARDENDSPIGTFTPNKDTKVHSCSGIRANGAHHANGGVKKENVTISWTAPREFQGEVVFTATALRDFVTYWVYMLSEPVTITKPPTPPQEILTPSNRRPGLFTLGSRGSSVRDPSQPSRGGGIRMIFQNIQSAATRLGSIFTGPRLRGNSIDNSVPNDNSVSGSTLALTSSSVDSQSPRTCNLPFFKRIFCFFQN